MKILPFFIATAFTCLSASFAQEALTIGPKHRYRFDNTSGSLAAGTQVIDTIGTAHGFIRGTGASANGSGVRLAGGSSSTAAYVDLPNASMSGSAEMYPGLAEASYEVWVTVHSNQSWSRILDFGNNSIDEVTGVGGTFNGADYLFISANVGTANNIRFERGGQFLTGGGGQEIAGATTLGTRMHLVATYDTTSAAWKLYKNGALIATVPTLLGPSTLDDLNVWLGRSNWGADSNADATYDEFRSYDYALSEEEVLGNYQAGPDTLTSEAPVFASNPLTKANGAPGVPYSGSIAGDASDPNAGDTLTFSKTSGPAWLAVAANGALGGAPPSGSNGVNAFTVRVTDAGGQFAETTLNITVTGSLPAGWAGADIGAVGIAGGSSENAGTYTVSGSGTDIWNTADGFHYASRTLTGNGEIRARVTSITNTDPWAKAGVMIRDGSGAGATHAHMLVSAGNLFSFQWRSTPSGWSSSSHGPAINPAPNNWVRLVRNGNVLTGYYSANGATWTQQGTATITMASSVSAGLAVTSHNNSVLNTATFDNVAVYHAPVFTANPLNKANGAIGVPYSGSIAGDASDIDGGSLTFSKTAGPAWLTVAANGALGGTPPSGSNGLNALTVRVTDATGLLADTTLNITVTGSLPSGWAGADIGATGIAGGASENSGTYTVSGSGTDIWNTADGFHFVSQTLAGDGEIRARVTSQSNTDPWAKAGVMIRDGSSAGAVNALVAATPSSGFTFQYRSAVSGSSAYTAGGALNAVPNNWVRLTRSGSLVTAYVSSDGTTWTQVGTTTLTMASSVSVGLAVTSHNNSALSAATFENVAVTPYPSPWLTADIGTTGLTGSAEYYSGAHTVKGAGTFGGTVDGFRYVYQTLSADGSIVARVSTLQNTGSSARVGIMMRDTLASNSRMAALTVDGSGAWRWQRRTTAGGSITTTNSSSGTAPNLWVRLVRSGNTITASRSTDGTTWTSISSATVTMASSCYVGLAVASGSTTTLNTSVMDNLTVVP